MSALVGALRAMLTLDSTAFVAGSKKATSASRKLQTAMSPLRKTMLGVSAAMATAAAGFALAIKGQLNAADEIGKAAQKFGIPVEALSRLKYAADLSDVAFETLGTGLKKLSTNMVAAANGGKAQTAMFAALGVAVVDTEGKLRGTEDVLQDVAAQFASMPDGAEKTAAVKLFGKAGVEMIPLLNAGKTGLQAMAEEANKLGIVISADTAKSAENFNDNLTRLKATMSGLVVQITAALAPTLERLSAFAVDVAKSFGELSPETKEMIVQLGAALGIAALATGAFGLLALAVSKLSVSIGLIAGAAALIYAEWDKVGPYFQAVLGLVGTIFTDVWGGIKATIIGAIDGVTVVWQGFMALLTGAVDKAKAAGQAIADALSLGKAEMNDGTGYGGMSGALDDSAAFTGGSNSSSAGAATADGLIDGFKTRLAERLAEIAASAGMITTAIRAQLGIQSPSTVMRAVGQHATEGLALGITDNVPLVTQAMGQIGDAIEGDGNSLQSRLETFKSSMEGAFVGLVTGAQSFREAIANLARSLADMLAKQAFQGLFGKLFEGGGGFLGGLFGGGKFADGAAFHAGRVTAFANGGVINGVTAFGMQSGLGIMGEAGPEAVMPLTRGSNGKLGVMSSGGGAQRVQIEITEGELFGAKVDARADARAVQIVRRYDRDVVPQSRQRPSRERG